LNPRPCPRLGRGRTRTGRGAGPGRRRAGGRGAVAARRGTGARRRGTSGAGAGTATPTGASGPVGTAGATGHRLAQLAGDRGLHGRGRRLHVLAKILQLAEDLLAGDAEFLRKLVYTGFACHCSPLTRRPGGSSRSTSSLLSRHVHGAIFTAGS